MTDTKAIETHSSETRRFAPSPAFSERARIRSASEYEKLYRESLDSPETFYRRETRRARVSHAIFATFGVETAVRQVVCSARP